ASRGTRSVQTNSQLFDYALEGSISLVGSDAESQRSHQTKHLVISGGDDPFHDLQPPFSGSRDQVEHQQGAEAPALPRVGNCDRKLARDIVCVYCIASDADFGFISALANYCDERHFPIVIDPGETIQHRFAQLTHCAKKTKIPRLVRQPLYEFLLYLPIFRTNRTHHDPRTVAQGEGLYQLDRIGLCHHRLVGWDPAGKPWTFSACVREILRESERGGRGKAWQRRSFIIPIAGCTTWAPTIRNPPTGGR